MTFKEKEIVKVKLKKVYIQFQNRTQTHTTQKKQQQDNASKWKRNEEKADRNITERCCRVYLNGAILVKNLTVTNCKPTWYILGPLSGMSLGLSSFWWGITVGYCGRKNTGSNHARHIEYSKATFTCKLLRAKHQLPGTPSVVVVVAAACTFHH